MSSKFYAPFVQSCSEWFDTSIAQWVRYFRRSLINSLVSILPIYIGGLHLHDFSEASQINASNFFRKEPVRCTVSKQYSSLHVMTAS